METLMIIIRTAIYMPFIILAGIFMAAFGIVAYITMYLVYYIGMPVGWIYDKFIKLLHKLTIL